MLFLVTDEKAIEAFGKLNYEALETGDPVHNSQILIASSLWERFEFKTYNKEQNKVVFDYDVVLAKDLNQILSKTTCVGID